MTQERPILMSSWSVQRLLVGEKTQTRRVINPQPPEWWKMYWPPREGDEIVGVHHTGESFRLHCPFGKPGDRLYVREGWARVFDSEPPFEDDDPFHVEYRADSNNPYPGEWPEDCKDDPNCGRWKPSIHMPKKFARIWLTLTEVRVQRVQEITEEDARAEGASLAPGERLRDLAACVYGGPRWVDVDTYGAGFQQVWDSINGKRAPWADNPWVFALTFEVET